MSYDTDGAEIQRLAEEIVEEKVANREMFTVYKDVTLAIRKDGTFARNCDVRTAVHGIYSSGAGMQDYQRSTIQPSGAPTPIFLYHPPEADISEYDANLNRTARSVPISTPSDPALDDDDDGVLRQTGMKNYLYIPGFMVRDIGLKVGETAYIYDYVPKNGFATLSHKGGLVVLSKLADRDTFGDLIAQYKVDVKGNIRIPGYHLPANSSNYRISPKSSGQDSYILISGS